MAASYSSLFVTLPVLAFALSVSANDAQHSSRSSLLHLRASAKSNEDSAYFEKINQRFVTESVSLSYNWKTYGNYNFVSGLISSPGAQGAWGVQYQGTGGTGWLSYGTQTSELACRQQCANDFNCWGYTWHDSTTADWSYQCYGRQPWTNNFTPYAVTASSGHWSGYKSIVSWDATTYPLTTTSGSWIVNPNWNTISGANYYSGAFGNPNVQNWNVNSGFLKVNGSSVQLGPGGGLLVASAIGAYNLGVVMDEPMCLQAANYFMYLELNSGSYSAMFANYYSYLDATAGDFANFCFVGAQTLQSVDSPVSQLSAHSGSRGGFQLDQQVSVYQL